MSHSNTSLVPVGKYFAFLVILGKCWITYRIVTLGLVLIYCLAQGHLNLHWPVGEVPPYETLTQL